MKPERNWMGVYGFFLLLFMAAVISICFVSFSLAQTEIKGMITTPDSTPVSGYPIKIESLDKSSKVIVVDTDNQGNYNVPGLAPGKYRVTPLNQPGLSKEVTVQKNQSVKIDPLKLPK